MRWAGDGIGHRFETVADAIAARCVRCRRAPLAAESALYKRVLASPWFAAVPAIVVGANLLHEHPVVYFGAGLTLTNVGIALCLDRCVTHVRTNRPDSQCRADGVRGVDQLFAISVAANLLNRESASALDIPAESQLAVSAALASYYIVERPALRFRRWLEKGSAEARKQNAGDRRRRLPPPRLTDAASTERERRPCRNVCSCGVRAQRVFPSWT
jgi:hypothetical protein